MTINMLQILSEIAQIYNSDRGWGFPNQNAEHWFQDSSTIRI